MATVVGPRFNLRREANPLATSDKNQTRNKSITFQSQAESQSAGSEAPLKGATHLICCFNLGRKANPLATCFVSRPTLLCPCFNLRREANPLATTTSIRSASEKQSFQSQARSQSAG